MTLRSWLRLAALVAVVAALAACSDEQDDTIEQVVMLQERVADAVSGSSSCAAMAEAITEVVDDHSEVLKRAGELTKTMDREQRSKLRRKYRERMRKATSKMVRPMARCATHPKVRAALERIRDLRRL